MIITKELLQFISEGASVERYHTRPGIKPDTDGHHSHGVAMLCSLLTAPDADGRRLPSASLLMESLCHDLGEQKASDMNAMTRAALRIDEELAAYEADTRAEYGLDYSDLLTADERLTLKLADVFDRALYCCRELALGNKGALLIWRNTCRSLESIMAGAPIEITLRASLIYEAVKEIHAEVQSPGGPSFDVFQT